MMFAVTLRFPEHWCNGVFLGGENENPAGVNLPDDSHKPFWFPLK